MRVAVLGSGMVGQALCRGVVSLGHEVQMGTRDPRAERIVQWTGALEGVSAATFADASKWCEIAFLCTNWTGTENALTLAQQSNLTGKIVVDVTNPLRVTDSGMELDVNEIGSGGEQIQRWLPESLVVKSLNVLNAAYMLDAQLSDGRRGEMFMAGNDSGAKSKVTAILQSAGWEVTDLGDISKARILESLAMLWITLARGRQEYDFALQPVALQHRVAAPA